MAEEYDEFDATLLPKAPKEGTVVEMVVNCDGMQWHTAAKFGMTAVGTGNPSRGGILVIDPSNHLLGRQGPRSQRRHRRNLSDRLRQWILRSHTCYTCRRHWAALHMFHRGRARRVLM